MAFPTPMYVELKNGSYLTIAGALLQTKDTVINYEQNNYRDQPPVLPAVSAASSAAGDSAAAIIATAAGVVGSGITSTPSAINTGDNDASATVTGTSSVAEDDNYTHKAPRPQMFLRDRFRWWDKANPGVATTITGTAAATTSPLLTVGSIEGLFVGQALSGSNIAVGAVIQELKYVLVAPTTGIQPTLTPTIVMSLNAAAASTAVVTVAAGADGVPNLLGECWCDRYIGWSSGIPTRF